MARKREKPLQDDPPTPFEPESRLPTEPWMKWTGVSFPAAVIVWFRSPKRIRRKVWAAVLTAMLVFAGLVLAISVAVGLVRLIDWALHS
jgi:hypothetical protein